jgi:hypothetical protein
VQQRNSKALPEDTAVVTAAATAVGGSGAAVATGSAGAATTAGGSGAGPATEARFVETGCRNELRPFKLSKGDVAGTTEGFETTGGFTGSGGGVLTLGIGAGGSGSASTYNACPSYLHKAQHIRKL